ncbi:hypothetical protein DGG96_09380 [Legionella qingyii]|uniref:Uncharacterized protein n=1 Tax=Legionella qingyii TaxID=2184757 RepID=A0A317U539_9GAMM|nr:hypothetical protein DGG96_09380 [Legionella qingyii]
MLLQLIVRRREVVDVGRGELCLVLLRGIFNAISRIVLVNKISTVSLKESLPVTLARIGKGGVLIIRQHREVVNVEPNLIFCSIIKQNLVYFGCDVVTYFICPIYDLSNRTQTHDLSRNSEFGNNIKNRTNERKGKVWII